jgi:hypothetical protein
MIRQLVSLDGEDDDFIQDVMVSYVEQLKDSVKKLDEALGNADMETVHLTAHSIKGASKQIGAARVERPDGSSNRSRRRCRASLKPCRAYSAAHAAPVSVRIFSLVVGLPPRSLPARYGRTSQSLPAGALDHKRKSLAH